MKTLRFSVFALGVLLAAGRVGAAFESVKPDPENQMPEYPLTLRMEGITRGTVMLVASIDATGHVADSLVLAYTQPILARNAVKALKEWRYTPAKVDGTPVPSQVMYTFNFSLEGAVITSNITNHFLYDKFDNVGDSELQYRLYAPSEVDHVPTPVSKPAPRYAKEAEQQGVRGKVAISFYIDEQGQVRMPAVSAAEGTQPYLVDNAVEALRSWKFEPATRHGRPVMVAATQEFDFSSAK